MTNRMSAVRGQRTRARTWTGAFGRKGRTTRTRRATHSWVRTATRSPNQVARKCFVKPAHPVNAPGWKLSSRVTEVGAEMRRGQLIITAVAFTMSCAGTWSRRDAFHGDVRCGLTVDDTRSLVGRYKGEGWTCGNPIEWVDRLFGDTPGASAADQVANRFGRDEARRQPSANRQMICRQFRPRGPQAQY